jgi:hypothetical protein
MYAFCCVAVTGLTDIGELAATAHADLMHRDCALRHLQYVALLMLCSRHSVLTGTPDSPCFKIAMIWLLLNLLVFIGKSSFCPTGFEVSTFNCS